MNSKLIILGSFCCICGEHLLVHFLGNFCCICGERQIYCKAVCGLQKNLCKAFAVFGLICHGFLIIEDELPGRQPVTAISVILGSCFSDQLGQLLPQAFGEQLFARPSWTRATISVILGFFRGLFLHSDIRVVICTLLFQAW